jgi:glycosyltransferase involved in cell wall biosynthesis
MIIENLSTKYDFYKDYMIIRNRSLKGSIYYIYFSLIRFFKRRTTTAHYDITVYFWWKSPSLIKILNTKKTLVGIFTEGYPPGQSLELTGLSKSDFVNKYLGFADGIIAGNRNIFNSYNTYSSKVYYATGATNIEIFKPLNKKKYQSLKCFIVCWTGNPNRKFKGYYDYILPAVKIARSVYPDILLISRFKGQIKTLPKFYSSVDVMINASVGDAGPGFIGDAGACGVPTISVNSGIASEVIEDNVTGFFVERDIDSIAEKIIYVYENRTILGQISTNIREKIVNEYSPRKRFDYWDQVFTKFIE